MREIKNYQIELLLCLMEQDYIGHVVSHLVLRYSLNDGMGLLDLLNRLRGEE